MMRKILYLILVTLSLATTSLTYIASAQAEHGGHSCNSDLHEDHDGLC
jgi:hypothetical protein